MGFNLLGGVLYWELVHIEADSAVEVGLQVRPVMNKIRLPPKGSRWRQ